MSIEFNFDEWAKLAKAKPKEFERKRQEAIETTIAEARSENQKHLRQLQWRIDMEIKRSKNPLEACVKVNKMLKNQVFKEGGFLDALKMFGPAPAKPKTPPKLKLVKK
ncbi:MAG TPA: DUF3135 domain-containing protein [Candidatus Campbellbacteria bacterium]|nr:DUF3135 domain-containing protein [Candidatus Campbellbacteria bacterium]